MHLLIAPASSALHLRPLARSWIIARPQPYPRPFTQNSRLRLVSPLKPRPQLPFLHPTTSRQPTQALYQHPIQLQLGRFLSTETKRYLKYQAILSARYTVIIFLLLVSYWALSNGISILFLNYQYPSPAEWSLISKLNYQGTKKEEEGDPQLGLVDWPSVFNCFKKLVERLEDPSIDGSGLRQITKEDGDLFVKDVGRTGFDVSEKSEEWRRGYFDCLLGAAKAAENVHGMVVDVKRNISFPADSVIGLSNPDPRPLPKGSFPAPREEDVQAFDSPALYYMRILTTHGFTSRQRLEAALTYADWLDSQGLSSAAEDMYNWGLDIAIGSLPHDLTKTVDVKTGIISNEAEHISANMLTASTALASHHARCGDLAAALPIFLSVLRARRQLPVPDHNAPGVQKPQSKLSASIQFIKGAVAGFPMAPSPSTGDEMPERTGAVICDEAGVMANIGEILFASTASETLDNVLPIAKNAEKNRQSGLGWTREAVALAESVLESGSKGDAEARKRCSECLRIGMENWTSMVATMVKQEQAAKTASQPSSWMSWTWGRKPAEVNGQWANEARVVAQRLKRTNKLVSEGEERQQNKPLIAALLGTWTQR